MRSYLHILLYDLFSHSADHQERMSLREFLTPSILKPLLVGMLLMIFQQFSGVNAYLSYLTEIFQNAGIKDANTPSILFAAAQSVATGVAAVLVDRTGRRILLLIGGIGMCICNILMGLYFILVQFPSSEGTATIAVNATIQSSVAHSVPLDHIKGLAPASAIIFSIFFAVGGWGPFPWLLMSEIFPPRSRGISSGIVTLVNWLSNFIVTKTFPQLITAFTIQGAFWFYAGCSLMSIIFVYIFVPETKGCTLEEIEALFRILNNKDSDKDSE